MSQIAWTGNSIRRLLGGILLALALATNAAASQDLRSPDTRDAALQAQQAPAQDLRSPDTRDTGSGLDRSPSPSPSPSDGSSSSFDWGYLALGCAGSIVVAGMGLVATRRRQRLRRPATVRG